MPLTEKLTEKVKIIAKPALVIYPLIIIILIPVLLVINTIWNLRVFNRDINFFIRHQAVSIADTLKPFIAENISNQEALDSLLRRTLNSNSDILKITLLKKEGEKIETVSTTNNEELSKEELGLVQLTLGFNEPFAGLNYDPKIGKNVWNVLVPLTSNEGQFFLNFKLKTDLVDQILGRTTKDSYLVLGILVLVTLILITNHFIFYRRAMKAQELAEINRLKDEFFSMASHELRAPVTAQIGYLEFLKTKLKDSPDYIQQDLDTLDFVTQDLRDLINDLLDISRLEQGRITVTKKDTQVNDVIEQIIKIFTSSAQQKGLVLNFKRAELPIVKTDPDRVKQVLTNLVNNAIKYSLRGSVEIKAEIKDKYIKIVVSDTGIGIPPEEMSKLFTKFHRVKDEKTPEVIGTGLGLWITKQLVELLGGKIYAESIYGTGSKFSFTLPIA